MSKNEKDRRNWRKGYTTGSCAAAAAKAACLILLGDKLPERVDIPLPNSARLSIPIHRHKWGASWARASVIKDGGDDPDITNGIEIIANIRILSGSGPVHILGGQGVGIVTKKGLAVPVGERAINPVPRQMIERAVREVFPTQEIEITIEVPEGERLAHKTLNPRLGIHGGISILGTTGIVRPMSEEAFKESILPELDQALAYGYQTIVLTPGHYGFKTATERLRIPVEAVVQMSNFVGYLLEEASFRQFKRVIMLGHIGKLIKLAAGIFHTHSRVADARMETLLAHGLMYGLKPDFLKDLSRFPTVEGAALELLNKGKGELLHYLAAVASKRAEEFVHNQVRVGTVFTRLNGELIGWDKTAEVFVKGEGWNWPV